MNDIALELYRWGPPKLKSELRLLQKKKTHNIFIHKVPYTRLLD